MVTYVPFLLAKIPDDSDFLKLKEISISDESWTLDYDKNGIKIWSKAMPDAAIKMFKVWSIFSTVSSVDLYNTILDYTYRKEWDPHLVLEFNIGHLNRSNNVSYYAVSCPPPLRSRDFVLQTSWLDRGAEHFILNHSVCHKDHPPKKGFIRAISFFSGYFIKCAPINDPQGIIPTWIVNKCTHIFAPRFVKQLERAAFAYKGWKSQNNPDFFPWVHPEQITSPKISVSDCLPSEEEQQSAFYKYLASKSMQIFDFLSSPPQVAFSTLTPCTSSSLGIIKLDQKASSNHSEEKSPGKSQKNKKSQKNSILNFIRFSRKKK